MVDIIYINFIYIMSMWYSKQVRFVNLIIDSLEERFEWQELVGTVVRGLRGPIINQGDDIEQIVVDTVINAAKAEGYELRDNDIISITESIVARAQGNYAKLDDIATDIQAKYPSGTLGVIFPILSRNRFANILSGLHVGRKSNLNVKLSFWRSR